MVLENKRLKNLTVTGYSGGGGKTHLVKKVLPLVADTHKFSVSHTTRKLRGNEKDGKDYYFIDVPTFLEMVERGEFLEWSNPREGIYYGTTREEYRRIRESGCAVLFDIDCVGVRQLMTNPEIKDDTCVIALLPNPEKRYKWMVARGDMPEETMSARIAYSEQYERPFFEDESNDSMLHWKIKPYDEQLPEPDAMIANKIANYICGHTEALQMR